MLYRWRVKSKKGLHVLGYRISILWSLISFAISGRLCPSLHCILSARLGSSLRRILRLYGLGGPWIVSLSEDSILSALCLSKRIREEENQLRSSTGRLRPHGHGAW